MKYLTLGIIFSLAFFIVSCDEDDKDNAKPENQSTLTVESYSKLNVDGQLKIIFNQADLKNTNEYLVEIVATEEQRQHIHINSDDGVLHIRADEEIYLEDTATVILETPLIEEIRLENDQVAVFEGEFNQEELSVVTEANSELYLYGIRVDNLFSKQEGESIFYVSTWSDEFEEERIYPAENTLVISDNVIMINHEFLVIGDNIVLSNDETEYIVSGDIVREHFLIDYADFKTEGNTDIHAFNAAVYDLNIKLEGNSEAEVWAINKITGKAEGSSVIYYRGTPDVADFELEGEAQIIPGG